MPRPEDQPGGAGAHHEALHRPKALPANPQASALRFITIPSSHYFRFKPVSSLPVVIRFWAILQPVKRGVKEVVESIHRGNKGLVLFSYFLACSVLGNLYYLPIYIWQCKIPLTDRSVGFAVIIKCATSKFCVSSRKCTMKH